MQSPTARTDYCLVFASLYYDSPSRVIVQQAVKHPMRHTIMLLPYTTDIAWRPIAMLIATGKQNRLVATPFQADHARRSVGSFAPQKEAAPIDRCPSRARPPSCTPLITTNRQQRRH